MKRLVCLVLVCIGCNGGGGASTLKIAAVEPNYGPLAGGTRVTLKGEGFLADGAAPNRVIVGGREAPLAGAIDDDTLEVVIPPGDMPGPADIVVLNRNGATTSSGTFHYSTAPAISSVTPGNVIYSSTSTVMTVTGSGFVDEGAGTVQVLVDGKPAIDVEVRNDSELVFTAQPGTMLTQADIEVRNVRGSATQNNAYRYAPGPRGGLLMFPDPNTGVFIVFYDPVDGARVSVPRNTTTLLSKLRTVVLDEQGDYWVFDRSNRWGRLDMETQDIVDPITTTNTLPAITRSGSNYFAINRNGARFGSFNPTTASFSPIGAATFQCCVGFGNAGLAIDPTGVAYLTAVSADLNGAQIRTVDTATGALGPPVKLNTAGTPHIVDQRFFDGTLYAAQRDGRIISINPTTGGTSEVTQTGVFVTAMEIVQ